MSRTMWPNLFHRAIVLFGFLGLFAIKSNGLEFMDTLIVPKMEKPAPLLAEVCSDVDWVETLVTPPEKRKRLCTKREKSQESKSKPTEATFR